MLNYYFFLLISKMEDQYQCLCTSCTFFFFMPKWLSKTDRDGMDDGCPFIPFDRMNFWQAQGFIHPDRTRDMVSNLQTIITDGILPNVIRSGQREVYLVAFLKMVLFIFKKFLRARMPYSIIVFQWRRIVLIVFRLSSYMREEIEFGSHLPLIMQNCGRRYELCDTFRRWARKSTLDSLDPFDIRFALQVTICNVVLPACCGEMILSDYDFWMLLRILKHLLGEIQITSSIHLMMVKFHGSAEDCFFSSLNDEEQAECDKTESAIHATQELLEMITFLINQREFSNGQHPLISRLLLRRI
jgi:hypothetical protein